MLRFATTNQVASREGITVTAAQAQAELAARALKRRPVR